MSHRIYYQKEASSGIALLPSCNVSLYNTYAASRNEEGLFVCNQGIFLAGVVIFW